jgi:hypothetical protein
MQHKSEPENAVKHSGERKLKENKKFDIKMLIEEAKASEHREAYRTLDRNLNFRIGIGVRLTPPDAPSFFVEILIYLCPTFSKADLRVLEKCLACLQELQVRNYSLTCQDGNCISCEKAVPSKELTEEYTVVKLLIKKYSKESNQT